jgi:hypothetical protein
MSSALVPTGGLFPTRAERQASKALARLEWATVVARCEDRARIDRIAGTTRHGMVQASQLATTEAMLTHAAPHAAGYIHAVALAGALGIAAVVHDAARGL